MIFFFFFSKAFPKGEFVNLACSIAVLLSEVNIYSLVRYSYLQILPEVSVDFFGASYLLISYCNFSSRILSSIVLISFCIHSKRFFRRREGLSDARVASITEKEKSFAVNFF